MPFLLGIRIVRLGVRYRLVMYEMKVSLPAALSGLVRSLVSGIYCAVQSIVPSGMSTVIRRYEFSE
jgi:hypothetical protein